MSVTSSAKADDTDKTNDTLSEKNAKLDGEKTAPVDVKEGETQTMENGAPVIAPVAGESKDASTKLALKSDKTQPSTLAISTRPVSSTKLVVRETINSSGIRPIAASDFQIAEMFNDGGMRPIAVSDLKFAETINIMGIRPIGVSSLKVFESVNMMGIRPIMASKLHISETIVLSGNRPVADNDDEDEDAGNLMGYLD